MGTERALNVEVDGAMKRIVPEAADYDAVIEDLRSKGRTFEVAAEEEVIEGTVGGTPQEEVFYEQEVTSAEAPIRAQAEADAAEGGFEVNERKVRRLANRAANNRPVEFLPGGATGTPFSINSLDTYKHFEPPVRKAIEAAIDAGELDDVQDLEDNGKKSDAYQGYSDNLWKKVHDAHVKHNLPVVRAERAGGAVEAMAGATKHFGAPVSVGADYAMTLGLGRQAMSGMADESPAEVELREAGVIPRLADRVKETAEEGWPGQILGGLAGSILGPMTRGVARAGGKIASTLAKGAGAATGKKVLAGTAATGALSEGVGTVGEEIVETGAELMSGDDVSLMSPGELGMRMVMGGGMSKAGEYVGKGADALRMRLGDPTTPGGIELAQLENLTGQRATTVGGRGKLGIDPGKTVSDEVERVARSRVVRPEGSSAAASMDEAMEPGVKKAMAEMVRKERMADQRMMTENEAYYRTPEGRERVSTKPIFDMLNNLKERRSRFDPDAIEMEQDADLPLLSTKQIDKYIKEFESNRNMNAQELDESIGALYDQIYSNKKSGSSNRLLKDIERSILEVRDQFRGNAIAQGPVSGDAVTPMAGSKGAWSDVKRRHSDMKRAGENARSAMNLKGVGDMSLRDSYKRALTAAKSLGKDAADSQSWAKVLEDHPKVLEDLRKRAAFDPYYKLVGGATEVPATHAGAIRFGIEQVGRRLDPIAELVQGFIHAGGPKPMPGMAAQQQFIPGTGAEQAQAAAVENAADIEAMQNLIRHAMGKGDQEDTP